jgi:cation diffusion facilitator family transporter
MRWIREVTHQQENNRLYNQALLITILGNLLLATGKGIIATISGSVALYAEAANSISDVLYSLLMVLGLRIAQRPPDLSHPQGHSRFEPLVGLMITLSMGFAGYSAGRAAIGRFITGAQAVEPGLPLIILIIAVLTKIAMYFRIKRIGRQVSSPTLVTAAKDNLMDVLASGAAIVGTLGSFYLHPIADPIAGLIIALWIFRAAFEAGKENLDYLTGKGAPEELRKQIVEIASAIPGVEKVHLVVTEYVGPHLLVDMHINVDGEMTINEAHEISDQVIDNLVALPEIDRAYVHLEPEGWQ